MPETSLRTVDRALQLLTLFTPERSAWSTLQVAEELNIHKSMASRLLATLNQAGFLERDRATRVYRLGYRMVHLGAVALASLEVRQRARPIMREIMEATGETVLLTVPRGLASVTIEKVETLHNIKLTMEVGMLSPLYAGASNKVLLAYLPTATIEEVIGNGLKPFTPHTITDPDALRHELETIRLQGWAWSSSELTVGADCVAVPVIGSRGAVWGLSVSGPSERFRGHSRDDLIAVLRQGATRLQPFVIEQAADACSSTAVGEKRSV